MRALLAPPPDDNFSEPEDDENPRTDTTEGNTPTTDTTQADLDQSQSTAGQQPISVAGAENARDGQPRQRRQQQVNNQNQDGGQGVSFTLGSQIPRLRAPQNNNKNLDLLAAESKAMRSEMLNMKAQMKAYEDRLKQYQPQPTPTDNQAKKRPPRDQASPPPPPKRSRHSTKDSHDTRSRSHHSRSKHRRGRRHGSPKRQARSDANDLHYQQQMQAAMQQSRQQHDQQLLRQQQQPPQTTQTSQQTAVSGTNISNLTTGTTPSDPWASFRNPFTPPALKEAELKKIEERKFVDFTDLLPENQATDITISSDEPAIDIDKSTGILTHNDHRVKKARVTSFHRWSQAWSKFAQAHLHYHPYDYFELFKYHATMIQHFNKYKFDACFKYDRDFRLTIQSERNMPPTERTCWWSRESEDLRNRHLINNPLPVCEKCSIPGHTEKTCRRKDSKETNTNLASVLSQALFPVAQQLSKQPQPPGAASNPPWKTASSNFRPQPFTTNNNNNSNKLPPSKKYCWRYAQGTPCSKPPCIFLHSCEICGEKHGTHSCDKNTSTNFIPISGP